MGELKEGAGAQEAEMEVTDDEKQKAQEVEKEKGMNGMDVLKVRDDRRKVLQFVLRPLLFFCEILIF